MKILYSAPGTAIPGTHGGSVHALELCRALSRRGHEVHLVALAGDARRVSGTDASEPAQAEVSAPVGSDAAGDLDGVNLHLLRRVLPVRLLEWTASRALRRWAERLRPDVVVERFYTFGGSALRAAQALGIPAVLEVNSPARPYPGSWRDRLDRLTLIRPVDRWRRRQLRWADAIYTTSHHLVPPELQASAREVTNGVDIERFRPGAAAADDGPLRCIYVSSFRAWHGAEDLVAAATRCVRDGVELHIKLLGEGPRWSAARSAAASSGIGGVVDFVGRVPHAAVPSHLAGADVGIAPFAPAEFSALELGWFWSPIKIFEYLAAGLAVVTADIAELRALLPDEVARFYPVGDVDSLAAALTALAADRNAVRSMGQAARQLAEASYTWDQQAAAVEELLEDVIVGSRSGSKKRTSDTGHSSTISPP